MSENQKRKIIVFVMMLVGVVAIGSFVLGRMHHPKGPTVPTGVVIKEPMPVVQECPQVEECIYNDRYSYKLIKFTHKDGTQCYGIRPYNQTKSESMWCEK